MSCYGKTQCEVHCPWRLASKVIEFAGDMLGVSDDFLFKDVRGQNDNQARSHSSLETLIQQGGDRPQPKKEWRDALCAQRHAHTGVGILGKVEE